MRQTLIMLVLCGCAREPSLERVRLDADPELPGVATLSWTSTEVGTASVEYGQSGSLDRVATSAASGTEHEVEVRGLKVGETWSFLPVLTVDGERIEGRGLDHDVPSLKDPPAMQRTVWDPELACGEGGYVVLSFLSLLEGRSWVAVIDREGDWVWGHRTVFGEWPIRVRPSKDGRGLVWMILDREREEDIGRIVHMSLDGTEITETRALNAHHDFVELPGGDIAWLGYQYDEAYPIGEESWPVATDAIYRAPRGASEGEEQVLFGMLDDYPPGIWDIGDDMALSYFLRGWREFSHGNSLMYDESADTFSVMLRWLDALIKVDASSGQVLWQLGGEHNDFSGPSDELFSHAHMSEMWEGGLLMFDNADNTGRISGVSEYLLDESGMSFERTWDHRDPAGGFEYLLGDAQRMPVEGCDNVLVSWATQFKIQELTRSGDVAWEILAPQGAIVGRVTFVEDIYRLSPDGS